MCHACGIRPIDVQPRFDRETRRAIQTGSQNFITDDTFFRMLGVDTVHSIDHTSYEGADIILNLNNPIPDDLHETADFVFGGSVCDNVFNPAMYIQNISVLIKKGGRFVDQNIITDHFHPYSILPPAWYFDYFVMNKFSDCKIYVIEGAATMNIYGLQIKEDFHHIWNFPMRYNITANGIFIIAEKGECSTVDRMPTQDQYRTEEEWREYRQNLRAILEASRPWSTFIMDDDYMRSTSPPQDKEGYPFLGMMWRNF